MTRQRAREGASTRERPAAGPWRRPETRPAPLLAGDDDEPIDLTDARLSEAELGGAALEAVDLRRATLVCAHLAGANLRSSRLGAADAALADLRGADLRGCDFDGADLRGADLREARCEGASFEGCALAGAQVAGATGLSAALQLAAGAAGSGADADGEARGLRAWRLGREAHGQGRLGLAEQRYREALGWSASSDVARWALAAAALERGEVAAALGWLDDAVAVDDDADRARLGAAAVRVATGDAGAARSGLQQAQARGGRVGALATAALADLDAGAAGDALAGLLAALPDDPALRWARAHLSAPRPPARLPRRATDTAARLGDAAWVEAEIADLRAALSERDAEPWQLQSVLVRALTVGEMELASRAETRLTRALPEARLWSTALRELDLTAEAIAALVRTRRGRLGAVTAVRWVALGAHGPTARVETEAGVYYAKRYHGATRPTSSVAYTHRVLRAMADAGVRVPLPLGDGGGDDVLVFGDDCLALYTEVGGVSVGDEDLSVAEAEAVGALCARIHAVGAGFSGDRPRGGLAIGTGLLRAPRPGAALHHRVAETRDAAIWYEATGLRSRLESRVELVGRRVAALLRRLPTTLVHGDLGAGNVLLGDALPGVDAAGAGRLEGIGAVDWDLATVDYAIYDLARAIDMGCCHWPAGEADPVEIRAGVARAMLRGYQTTRRLSDAERALLPILIAASRVELDAGLLALLASHEADAAIMLATRALKRLDRAVAGAPEVALALGL